MKIEGGNRLRKGTTAMANVLLMDNDRLFCRYVESILNNSGHSVAIAFDGIEGIAAFKRDQFDLVIVEIFMPRKEGIETIRELVHLDEHVSIIAVTAGASSFCTVDYLKIATKFGAQNTLRKHAAGALPTTQKSSA